MADNTVNFETVDNKRVQVQEWRGNKMLHVREYYTDANGEDKPTRKGVTFKTVDEVDALIAALEVIKEDL